MDGIYARQSVEKADSLSIQGQIDLCRREVGERYKVYQDRGYSGKNTNRPAFRAMMQDVENGMIKKIVVYRLDRFSRSIADFGRLWEILRKHGVEFVSINETFDTSTPMGRAMLSIIMVFAQLERETTAQRVRDNYYHRAKLGAWPGGPAPYGFSIGEIPGTDGRISPGLIPNDRARIAVRIFDEYARKEATLGSVARLLNDQGIPGPRRATWDNVSLSRILRSPVYVMADEEVFLYYIGKGVRILTPVENFDGLHGSMLLGKRDRGGTSGPDEREQLCLGSHVGLVPAPLWLCCQYKLETNRQLGRRGRGKHTWMSGLLKCACCGYSVKVNRDGDKYYLICSGRSNLKVCMASIRVDLRGLESGVEAELEHLLSQCPPVEEPEEGLQTDRVLRALEKKIDRLLSAVAEGSEGAVPYLNRAVEQLEEQRIELVARQHNILRRRARGTGQLRFSTLEFEEKKLVAAQFIREIRLADDTAEVLWNI